MVTAIFKPLLGHKLYLIYMFLISCFMPKFHHYWLIPREFKKEESLYHHRFMEEIQ